MKSVYDSEIKEVDISLGKFFNYLNESGFLSNTIIIFTSDHGEEFFEHEGCSHLRTLYNELIHVPLLIYIPEGRKNIIERPIAASISILPTILNILDVKEELVIDGTSIFDEGHKEIFSEVHFQYNQSNLSKTVVIIDKYKLIYNENFKNFELYDLKNDFLEQNNIYDSINVRIKYDLLSSLSKYLMNSSVSEETASFKESDLSHLKALGYMN